MAVERVNWGKLRDRRIHNCVGVSKKNVTFNLIPERLRVTRDKKTQRPSVEGGVRVQYDPACEVPGAKPLPSFALFTFTTKMSCASFSLPAGLHEYGGTCPASDPRFAQRYGISPGVDPETEKPYDHICSICYAGKGRYKIGMYIHIGQEAHRIWVRRLVEPPGGPALFADEMTKAIALLNSLSDVSVAKVCDPLYFRIHDSGDCWTPGYLMGWIEVARRMPDLRFWMPTRTWIFPAMRHIISGDVPRNLVIRPSALFVNSPPPMLPGCSAGSMCAKGRQIDSGVVTLPGGVYDCPAYAGESIHHTCAAKNCRVCWEEPTVPVNYREH
jgi:hypothetical protein